MPPSYRGQSIQLFPSTTLLQGLVYTIISLCHPPTGASLYNYFGNSLCHPPTGASLYNNIPIPPSYRGQSIQLFPYATLLQVLDYTFISPMPPSYRGQSIQLFPYATLLQGPAYTIISLCHPPTGASLYNNMPIPPSYKG